MCWRQLASHTSASMAGMSYEDCLTWHKRWRQYAPCEQVLSCLRPYTSPMVSAVGVHCLYHAGNQRQCRLLICLHGSIALTLDVFQCLLITALPHHSIS